MYFTFLNYIFFLKNISFKMVLSLDLCINAVNLIIKAIHTTIFEAIEKNK